MSTLFVRVNDTEYEVSDDGDVVVSSQDTGPTTPVVRRLDSTSIHVLNNGVSTVVRFDEAGEKLVRVATGATESTISIRSKKDRLLDRFGMASGPKSGDGIVKAPMPGLVLRLMVEVGESVSSGQGVLVLEAMKMENELKAPVGGVVKALHVVVGEAVGKNTPLVEIAVAS